MTFKEEFAAYEQEMWGKATTAEALLAAAMADNASGGPEPRCIEEYRHNGTGHKTYAFTRFAGYQVACGGPDSLASRIALRDELLALARKMAAGALPESAKNADPGTQGTA